MANNPTAEFENNLKVILGQIKVQVDILDECEVSLGDISLNAKDYDKVGLNSEISILKEELKRIKQSVDGMSRNFSVESSKKLVSAFREFGELCGKIEEFDAKLQEVEVQNNAQKRKSFSIDETDEPDVTFDEKLDRVKKYLLRWAKAEKYADPKDKIGYEMHLQWLVENEKIFKKDPKDKKAEAVLNAYVSMPGFGCQRDRHKFVDMHMEIDLLELEIKGLEKTNVSNKNDEEIREKKEAKEDLTKELIKALKQEAEEINERLEEVVQDDPENEKYVRPIVENYLTWLVSMKKRGTMPQFTILDGPPGTGKTYFGETIAKVLGLDFQMQGMSSESDETIVPGRDKGWDVNKPGKGAELQIKSKSQLFLWYPDELEKAEKNVINTYVDLFESGRMCYTDKFFNNISVPKYYTTFIATTNQYNILPAHIQSRSKKIVMKGKKPEEKLNVIRKRLKKGIENSAILQDKNIICSDQTLLWFLKKYSTQPGFREDNQNVDTMVSELTKYFLKNSSETDFEIKPDFIDRILQNPPAYHQEKIRLSAEIEGLEEDLLNKKGVLGSTGTTSMGEKDKEALLAEIITNQSLLRINTGSLIKILKEDLERSPYNIALLQPDIQYNEGQLSKYKRFGIEEIEFLSKNIKSLEELALTPEILTELITERSRELSSLIESSKHEVARYKTAADSEKKQRASEELKKYNEEKVALEELTAALNQKEKLGDTNARGADSSNNTAEVTPPPPPPAQLASSKDAEESNTALAEALRNLNSTMSTLNTRSTDASATAVTVQSSGLEKISEVLKALQANITSNEKSTKSERQDALKANVGAMGKVSDAVGQLSVKMGEAGVASGSQADALKQVLVENTRIFSENMQLLQKQLKESQEKTDKAQAKGVKSNQILMKRLQESRQDFSKASEVLVKGIAESVTENVGDILNELTRLGREVVLAKVSKKEEQDKSIEELKKGVEEANKLASQVNQALNGSGATMSGMTGVGAPGGLLAQVAEAERKLQEIKQGLELKITTITEQKEKLEKKSKELESTLKAIGETLALLKDFASAKNASLEQKLVVLEKAAEEKKVGSHEQKLQQMTLMNSLLQQLIGEFKAKAKNGDLTESQISGMQGRLRGLKRTLSNSSLGDENEWDSEELNINDESNNRRGNNNYSNHGRHFKPFMPSNGPHRPTLASKKDERHGITTGFNVIQRLAKEAGKDSNPALSGKIVKPMSFKQVCEKEQQKIQKMQDLKSQTNPNLDAGVADINRELDQNPASEAEVVGKLEQKFKDQGILQYSKEKGNQKYAALERFEHKLNTIAMYENLEGQMVGNDQFVISEKSGQGSGEPIVNVNHDNRTGLVKIVSESSHPGEKALLEMVLFIQKCSSNGRFKVEHCEDNAEAGIKLYLYGKALGLKPELNAATRSAVDEYVSKHSHNELVHIYQNALKPTTNPATVLEGLKEWEDRNKSDKGFRKK